MASLAVVEEDLASLAVVEDDFLYIFKKLPEVLLEYVCEFFRGDFKTWASFLQTCKFAHNKYITNLVKLKVLWMEIQNISGIDHCIKKQIYNTYFYIKLTYNNIGVEGARYVAEALKTNTLLKTLDLEENNIGAEGAKALAPHLGKMTALQYLRLNV